MEKAKKNIIEVVPVTRIPLYRNQSFSYLSDRKIGVGSLVSVPLFKRKIEGIVVENRPDFKRLGNIELKSIGGILEEDFLDSKQMELAQFISGYYFSSLGLVMKSFIPKRIKARKAKLPIRKPESVKGKEVILTADQQKAVDAIINSKFNTSKSEQNSKFYLYGPAGSGKTEVYIHSILSLIKQNSQPKAGPPRAEDLQFLILLPELTLTPQAIERYGVHFKPEEMVLLHSKVPKGEFYKSWKKIRSGEAKIIIGSRMAVFAPFKKLGLIVVDEEQDISFKQWDMNPRYGARTVAEKLAELHKAKIVFGSATPSIEYYYHAINKKICLLNLPGLKLPGKSELKLPEVTVVDLKKERWQKNYSSISKKLQTELSYALKNKLQSILFVNRQGMSNFSICANCKSVLKCPKCERSLIYDTQGVYRCLHCSYKTSIFPKCAKCNGLNFSNIGIGTQKVEREISQIFPGARIARADSQTMKNSQSHAEIYRKFSEKYIDILIGTQVISKGWDLPSVSLIGIIDTDNILSLPDLDANIRAYQNIVQVSGRSGRPGAEFPGSVVIQTFNPEHFVVKAAAKRDFTYLYDKEISERRNLFMPPFGKIVKLIFQDSNPKKVDLEAERVFLALTKEQSRQIKVYEPQTPLVSNVRGRWRKQIIMKLTGAKFKVPSGTEKVLNFLPNGWIIDVDPITIN